MIDVMSSEGAGAGEVAALCIESPRVSVWKRGGHVVIAILVLAIVLITAGVPVLGVLMACLVLEIWRRVHAALSGRTRPARVRVSDFLEIERAGKRFYARKVDITDSWQRPDPESIHVDVFVVTAHALISIRVPDRTTADIVSRALGVDPASNLVSTTLSAQPTLTNLPWHRRLPGVVLGSAQFWGWAAVAMLALLGPLRQEILPLLVVIASLMVVLPAIRSVLRVQEQARVFVGRDGLLLTLRDRREFIGFERVSEVSDGLHAIAVKLTSGEEISLPLAIPMGGFSLWKPHPLDRWFRDIDHVLARRRALARQIKEALQRFRDAGADPRTEALARLLDRGSRSFREWRESLSCALADTYRERRPDAEELVNVFENPRIPLGQRLGAVLALSNLPGAQAFGPNVWCAGRRLPFTSPVLAAPNAWTFGGTSGRWNQQAMSRSSSRRDLPRARGRSASALCSVRCWDNRKSPVK